MASVSDLLMRQGEDRAQARLRRAHIYGGLIQGLAQIPGQIVGDYQNRKASQAQAAAEAEREDYARGRDAMEDDRANREIRLKEEDAQRKAEEAQQARQREEQETQEMQAFGKQHADTIIAEHGPQALDAFMAASRNPEARRKFFEQRALALEPKKPADPFTLGEGQTRFAPDGTPIANVPKPVEPEKPDARSLNIQLADAITKGDMQRASAIRQAIRQAEQAGRAPEKPADPLERQERELRIQKLQQEIEKANKAPENEKLDAILPVLAEIKTLSERINNNRGPAANVVGAVRTGLAAVNMDDDVALYRSAVRGMTPMLARAVGHTGVLTELDVQRTEELFPKVGLMGTDSKSVAGQKLQQFERLITGNASPEEKTRIKKLMGWDKTAGTTKIGRFDVVVDP